MVQLQLACQFREGVIAACGAATAAALRTGGPWLWPHELPCSISCFPGLSLPSTQIYSPTSIPSFFTTRDKAMWAAVRKGCAPAFSPENMRRTFPAVRCTALPVFAVPVVLRCLAVWAACDTPAGKSGPVSTHMAAPAYVLMLPQMLAAAYQPACRLPCHPTNPLHAQYSRRDTVDAVCDHLAARAASGATAAEGGEDMQQATLRVALDAFALSALQHDFGARHYRRCDVLEVGLTWFVKGSVWKSRRFAARAASVMHLGGD